MNTDWPDLPFEAWRGTATTLHLWTQIVGKIRLQLMPWINHSWHVTLYPTTRGLATGPMPVADGSLSIEFDFQDGVLRLTMEGGATREIELRPRSVADFHDAVFAALDELGVSVRIHETPNELPDPVPFPQDTADREFDLEAARRFARVLLSVDRVFQQFRARFLGKVSPVHFFWGSFDLAVTRFSGRPAPRHPAGIPYLPDWVAREAYSHEVSSAGFWPGSDASPTPIFYAYAYPEPDGFAEAEVQPEGAFYHPDLKEWVLPYDSVRQAENPAETLLLFLETSYRAAADLAGWDRATLERNTHPRHLAEFR